MSVKKKPLVVVTRKLPDSIETRMRELFDARLNLDDTPLTTEQIAEAVRSADILVPPVTDGITEELLKQPDCKLKLIANFGNGVDNIDVVAAHARGITVTNTPKVLTEDTAAMTMRLFLAGPGGRARRWRAGRTPSGCRFTITTAARWRRALPRNWARPIGRASTRCWRGWTSS